MHYVFVYGTLRKGGCRFDMIAHAAVVSKEAYLADFMLINLGSFPGIAPNTEAELRVLGEVYQIEADDVAYLDHIEGYVAGYPERSLYLPPQLLKPLRDMPMRTELRTKQEERESFSDQEETKSPNETNHTNTTPSKSMESL